jgi:hypothetical protein
MHAIRRALLLALLGLLPFAAARAQLDPRLQKTKTDFLDLFQLSKTQDVKPEILSLMDYSGSMNQVMFHPRYPNNLGDDATANAYKVIIRVNKVGGVWTQNSVTLGYTTTNRSTNLYNSGGSVIGSYSDTDFKDMGANELTSPDYGDGTGKYKANPATKLNWVIGGAPDSATSPTYNCLIRPDGAGGYRAVTLADVQAHTVDARLEGSSASPKESNALNWMRCATHARLKATWTGGPAGGRIIDLPLHWTDFSFVTNTLTSNGAIVATNTAFPASACTTPLKAGYAVDPISGQNIEFDTGYLDADTTNTMWRYYSDYRNTGISPALPNTDTPNTWSTAIVGGDYGDWSGWRGSYIGWLFSAKDSAGRYWVPSATAADSSYDPGYPTRFVNLTSAPISAARPGFTNGIYGLSRIQAIKEALIRTWILYQNKVIWAVRGLATTDSTSPDPTPYPSPYTAAVVPTDNGTSGGDRNWVILNANSVNGMKHIAKSVANTGTPLTTCTAASLVELQSAKAFKDLIVPDPNSTTGGTMTYQPLVCTKQFFLLLTDGNPSGESVLETSQPYLTGPAAGNRSITASTASIKSGQAFWNVPTLMGAAAHLGDIRLNDAGTAGTEYLDPNSNTIPTVASTFDKFLPLWTQKRTNAAGVTINFVPAHAIESMTVGVSLGVNFDASGNPIPITTSTETDTPKFRLLMGATFGDPDKLYLTDPGAVPVDGSGNPTRDWKQCYDPTKSLPFGTSTTDADKKREVSFFDGADPASLVNGLAAAFEAALAKSGTGATAAPGFPFVGSGFGNSVYLAKFNPPVTGGPLWPGDLAMFPTMMQNDKTTVINASGTPVTGDLNNATPMWSAAARFQNVTGNLKWYNRRLYTRIPSTDPSKPNQLVRFQDTNAGTEGGFTDFKAYLTKTWTSSYPVAITGTDAEKQLLVRFVMGANTDQNNADQTLVPNRTTVDSVGSYTTSVMGDIVNSTPAVVEYSPALFNSASCIPGSPLIAAATHLGETGKNPHFRVIFVGSNQGFLHAFGEISWEEKVVVGGVTIPVTNGVVDELWAFVPTDFLRFFDYLRDPKHPHTFGVDGVPFVYHLDLAPAGEVKGNAMIDAGEKALVVFGLGKGGRSVYALNIENPFKPALNQGTKGWALVPDESNDAVISKMGFSTATPMVGRMISGTAGTKVLKDILFLGGGYSTTDVETDFPAVGSTTKLGRSVVALDVLTGGVLKSWALNTSTAAPISAGVVPFELVPNSGLTQRAYFLDHMGKLYALGQNTNATLAAYNGLREDSSELGKWADSARIVFKGDFSPAMNNVVSTLPAPFRIANFAVRRSDPKIAPPTTGISWVTGDRNDPVDIYPGVAKTDRPDQFRLVVVFDRGDQSLWSSLSAGVGSGQLYDMTSMASTNAVIQPGSDTFYLNPKVESTTSFGYYIKFPGPQTNAAGFTYIPKGLFPPIVFLGYTAWSYFLPTKWDACLGGNGETHTNLLCDVMKPVFQGNQIAFTGVGCKGGESWVWQGVASKLIPKSLTSVVQSGMVAVSGSTAGSLQVQSISGATSYRFVRPRVWRTIH